MLSVVDVNLFLTELTLNGWNCDPLWPILGSMVHSERSIERPVAQ